MKKFIIFLTVFFLLLTTFIIPSFAVSPDIDETPFICSSCWTPWASSSQCSECKLCPDCCKCKPCGHVYKDGVCQLCGEICLHEIYKYGACLECNERAPIYEPCLVFLRGIGNYASSVLDGIFDPVTKELTSHGKTVCSLLGFLLFGYVGIAVKDRSFMKGVKR